MDLARFQADIAIRPAVALSDEFVGIAATDLAFAAYGLSSRPETDHWLALRGALARSTAASWLETCAPDTRLETGADSFLVLRDMVLAGLGAAVLPCVVGDGDPRLSRRAGGDVVARTKVWVVSHADLADAPRLRAMRERLAAALREDAARLGGRAVAA